MSFQEHNLQAGLALFNGHPTHNTNSDGQEKSNESNNPSPMQNTHAAPHSSSTSNVKSCGSNRFVLF